MSSSRQFQSTHPSGVRPDVRAAWARAARISIHAPQWGATVANHVENLCVIISIHAPQWGATSYRDVVRFVSRISIHAPQWGATNHCHPTGPFRYISIHAPQWGATGDFARYASHANISIHAPQWGATRSPSMIPYRHPNFNPRTPVGCDAFTSTCGRSSISFQSTHPSGVRLIDNDDRYHTYLFQSTHPSGVRRSPTANPCTRIRISIHAPQWGATKFKVRLTITPEISIHAPQWGATLAEGVKTGAGARFQSTHPSGVRLASRGELRFARFEFQSTHPSGVRLSVISVSWAATYFNPRTPVGCDDSAPILGPPFMVFQSTHPSGVRRCALGSRRCPLTISIHAPQWGATWHTSIQCRQPPISIHAPQWGATCSDLQ